MIGERAFDPLEIPRTVVTSRNEIGQRRVVKDHR
jgi:hypothetical protein